jgi:hypothetical protein
VSADLVLAVPPELESDLVAPLSVGFDAPSDAASAGLASEDLFAADESVVVEVPVSVLRLSVT